jgi:predicted ATP-dependent serine protease
MIDLMAEYERGLEKVKDKPINIGMFRVMTANGTIKEASMLANPKSLYLSFWYEGEVCCLFADCNLGKSILAVQIANEIARTEKILYFDFELSDKQFQLRYSDEQGNLFLFPDNLFRVSIDRDAMDMSDLSNFEDAIIKDIEETIVSTDAKIAIIDNLTYLCLQAEKGDAAGSLMFKLMALKRKYGLSLLILSHTPKRPLTAPITQNDLAGSKRLMNFFDSAFAIGRSAKDENLRYLKQIKCRYGSFEYDGDNVIVCSIEKDGTFLKFTNQGFSTEREHLKELSDKDASGMIDQVKELISQGKSYRQVSTELGISLAKVQRLLKK